MKTTMAVLDKAGGDAAAAVVSVLKSLHTGKHVNFGIASSTIVRTYKDVDAFRNYGLKLPVVMGYAFSNAHPNAEPQCVKLEDAAIVFDGQIYSPTGTSAIELLAKKPLQRDRGKALFDEIEGDFSFLIAEPKSITAGRDVVGVQPLYYGENKKVAALASSRKALWKLGIEKTSSFPPGNLAFVTSEGFKFKPVKTLTYAKPKTITMQTAAKTLQKLLEQSIHRRIAGTTEVAVAFSGGLDSSVVAFLAKKCGADMRLIHVSLENRPETEEAKKAADLLRLPIQVHLFKEADVEKVISKVVGLIEEPDPVKASIGIPFYWTAEKAAEAGLHVLLAGQGADELFGGYQRYVSDYLTYGEENVRRAMFEDVARLHESNIERDVKICRFHGVELRLPFASYQIAQFALSLPLELKIEKNQNSLRKLVLRKVAENIGLPKSIVEKPKKAMQYATGVSDALKNSEGNKTVKEYVNMLFFAHVNKRKEAR
ncbi:MAG: asparagine synthetase B [Candidatus Bathyarchaeota archaeon]|nr:asparagine synthetase B [Candidatus Bathyarchaeota archaeon]